MHRFALLLSISSLASAAPRPAAFSEDDARRLAVGELGFDHLDSLPLAADVPGLYGEQVVVLRGTAGETFDRLAPRADQFFAAIRRFSKPVTLSKGRFGLVLEPGRVRCGTREVVSADRLWDGDEHHGNYSFVVESQVGPFLMVRRSVAAEAAGGPPYGYEALSALDVRTGAPVSVEVVFDRAAVLAALKAELPDRDVEGAPAPVDVIGTQGWAISGWDAATGEARVTISFDCPQCPSRHKDLPIRAKPRKEWVASFNRVVTGEGFFSDAKLSARSLVPALSAATPRAGH